MELFSLDLCMQFIPKVYDILVVDLCLGQYVVVRAQKNNIDPEL